jgi:hypothetical protein
MRGAKALVVVLLTLLALLIGIWGGWLVVSGLLGNGTDDIAPWFFVVFGSILLVLSGAVAWAALMLHRRTGRFENWSLVLFLVLVLGVLIGVITGFWLGASVIGALMIIATVVRSIEQNGGPQ